MFNPADAAVIADRLPADARGRSRGQRKAGVAQGRHHIGVLNLFSVYFQGEERDVIGCGIGDGQASAAVSEPQILISASRLARQPAGAVEKLDARFDHHLQHVGARNAVNRTVLQVMICGITRIQQRWKILNSKTVIYSTRMH